MRSTFLFTPRPLTFTPPTWHSDPNLQQPKSTKSDRFDQWCLRLGFRNRMHLLSLAPLYFIFVFMGIHLIGQGAYHGQDFGYHCLWVQQLSHDPFSFPYFGSTNPPMLYILGALALQVFGTPAWLCAISLFLLLINLLALHLCYLIAKRICSSNTVLLAGMYFIALLPFTLITSVVFASDALTPFFFYLYVFCWIRMAEDASSDSYQRHSRIAALAMLFGALSKYTFVVFIPISILFFIALLILRRPTPSQASSIFVLAVLIPTLSLGAIRIANSKHSLHNTTFPKLAQCMKIKRLLLPTAKDLYILSAPSYGKPIELNGTQIRVTPWGRPRKDGELGFELLVNNRYSYPALLHLALHTDPLNIAWKGLSDGWGIDRPKANQLLQSISVSLGLPFSLLAPIAVLCSFASLFQVLRPCLSENSVILPLAFTATSATIAYLATISMFPFLIAVYYAGYWLPRLVFPSILGFGILGIFFCDQMKNWLSSYSVRCSAIAGTTALILVTLANFSHILLLWR